MERTTVPFHIGTTYVDMASQRSVRGVVRFEKDHIVVEYRVTTVDMTGMKTQEGPVLEVRIPVDDIESIEVGRQWIWGAPLRIRVRKLAVIEGLPGATGNEVRLRVRRRDHDRARELCIGMSLLQAGEDIRRLEGGDGEAG
jgi:hypothetical protein